MKEHKDKKKNHIRNKKRDVIFLGVAVLVFWLVLLIVKILYAHANGENFDFIACSATSVTIFWASCRR